MKVFCPSCERIAPAASYRVDGGSLIVRCSRCQEEAALELDRSARTTPPPAPPVREPSPPPPAPRVLPLKAVTDAVRLAAEAAQSPDPFAVPDDRCPKCIAPRAPDATTCAQCGLAYVNFRPSEVEPSAELAATFRAALARWDDPAVHDIALSLATQGGELPQLGRLYRIRLAAAPMDPVALRGRDEVLRRASAASEVLRVASPSEEERRFAVWQVATVAFLAAVVAVIFGAFLLKLVRG